MSKFARIGRPALGLLLFAASLALGGCDRLRFDRDLPIPDDAVAASFYDTATGLRGVEVRGNLVEVRIAQPARQLERGGSLWARVGPYIYLFSPSTRDLFERYPGVAAVRVVTVVGRDREVARAMLRRDAMGEIRWQRSLNILGHALNEGTKRPSLLEDLVQWGEEHTEFEYDPAYVPRPRGGTGEGR